ncbi:SRPBCC family protein [Mycobacterium hackensackense]|uniref:SRPBCC family protein n=1 Tax=Mycobacterium hackensackense TaxID=228909 RepID=UPI0022657F34|nr:SRPBCC family protein [Mycobacterium hackensackense]MCV7256866.1 SRPBCC family protein [Mycobacterium hackensackense]
MTTPTIEFSVNTEIRADVTTLWEYVIRPEGFAHELGPHLRMTIPAGFQGQPSELSGGQVVGSSTVLLWGLIPIERARITILEIDPPHRIRELHTMVFFSRWQQTRELSPVGPDRTRVTDTITYSLRRPWIDIKPLARRLEVAWLHHIQARQKRLAAAFESMESRKETT